MNQLDMDVMVLEHVRYVPHVLDQIATRRAKPEQGVPMFRLQ